MGIAPQLGTARAKLLLFGEHAAVYGHPAVGRSLPWTLTAHHSPGPDWLLPGLGPHEVAVRQLVGRLEVLASSRGLSPPRPGLLEMETAIPLGSGFGSSGALCAALVNLFWPTLPLADRDTLAWEAEAQFHGTTSGIDTALALREGWWALDSSTRPVTATALPDPGLVLVVGAVVRTTDTRSLVGGLAQRRADGDPTVVRTLQTLGGIASQAVEGLRAGQTGGIPGLTNRAREALATLGLETPDLKAVLDAGLACPGAQAGKLSGAGGGGAFFLLFDDQSTADEAIAKIRGALVPERWTSLPLRV